MKKSVNLFSLIVLFSLSGSAFAQSNFDHSALKSALSLSGAAMADFRAPAVPLPDRPIMSPGGVGLHNITWKCIQNGEVVSAFPAIYKKIYSEENSRIIRVFRVLDNKGEETRLEVYYTGGDWMQYGFVYFVTNAGQRRGVVSAYFMHDLSTPDREDGAVAPRVDPFDLNKLVGYISNAFMDAEGKVQPVFGSASVASVSI